MVIKLDKENPVGTVKIDADLERLSGIPLIIADDVLNTGRTMTYSLMALLETEVTKVEIAVLVDRGHRKFPVSATFSGYQLSTTLEEQIEVKLDGKPAVYLY